VDTRARITKHVHPHLLRHSWMTEMLRQGMNPLQLSLIAGTSLPVIMEHYTHLTKEDAYEAMIRVLAVTQAEVNGEPLSRLAEVCDDRVGYCRR